jgi:hypothetical protein
VEDARSVWIYRAVPDCLADATRDEAWEGGHAPVWALVEDALIRNVEFAGVYWCCCTVGVQSMRQR